MFCVLAHLRLAANTGPKAALISLRLDAQTIEYTRNSKKVTANATQPRLLRTRAAAPLVQLPHPDTTTSSWPSPQHYAIDVAASASAAAAATDRRHGLGRRFLIGCKRRSWPMFTFQPFQDAFGALQASRYLHRRFEGYCVPSIQCLGEQVSRSAVDNHWRDCRETEKAILYPVSVRLRRYVREALLKKVR